MHSSRMRTGRTLTVFRWRTPPKIWRNPPKKTPPKKFGATPPKKDTSPPKIWRNPPKKRPPLKIWRNPPKKRPPQKFGGTPKIRAKSGAPPQKKLEQNLEHPPVDRQTPVKILPWPKLRFGR